MAIMMTSRAAMEELMADTQSSDNDSDCGRPESPPLPDACHRCGTRVYPVERVDVGALFHRRCFRCRVCGLQLTLRTFQWDQSVSSDVFCPAHVPRHVGTIDNEAVGIKNASSVPKRGVMAPDQTRGSVYNPGWQYDANAMEFAHYKEQLYRRGKQKTCTGTYRDFEQTGIFEAQTQLEKVQKAEEDELYMQIREERKKKVSRLEEDLRIELERSVGDMVTTFEKFSPQRGKTRLQSETERLEETFRRKKEEKVKKMLDRLSNEQRARVAGLIQKHSQEMLLLIAERLTASEDRVSSDSDETAPLFDLSRPPPVTPPELKRSQLFKSPKEFEKIDNHVFQVMKRSYSSFTSLVKALIMICETDLEKARAIFRWVTWTDLNELEVEEGVNPDSPLGLLRGIKYGTETYHDLARRLCSYAGLYCEVIEGYSKGAGYKPGMKMESDRFRNSWTAVSIDGSWCFVNCNWGARHVKAENRNGTIRHRKTNGPRLDSDIHNHHDNVEVMAEQDTTYQGLSGSSIICDDSKFHKARRELSELPSHLALESGSVYAGNFASQQNSNNNNSNSSWGLPDHVAKRHSRFRTGSLGSVTDFQNRCGLQRVASNDSLPYGGVYCNRDSNEGVYCNRDSNEGGSDAGGSVCGGGGVGGNCSVGDGSIYGEPSGVKGSYSYSSNNSTNGYAVPQGFSTCEMGTTVGYLNASMSQVRKLQTNRGSNKENSGDSGIIVDGYSGKSLLDAFYNKDIKSKLAVARLSDDSTGYSSGCSKSSNERLTPPNSPFLSAASSSGSSGGSSCNNVILPSSKKPSKNSNTSPPRSLSHFPTQPADTYGNKQPSSSSPTKLSYAFRNSSESDSSSRLSPTQTPYKGIADLNDSFNFSTSDSHSLLRAVEQSDDLLRNCERLSPPHSLFSRHSSQDEYWRRSDSSGGNSVSRRDSISTVGESVVGEDPGTDLARQPLFYECDEFYFITDPEDHIYQHFPDDPAWQLLEVPITMSEFLDLPVVKSPFFNAGLKFAAHYDCKQYTTRGEVTFQLKIPKLLTFGYTLVPRDKRLIHNQNTLDGRVLLRIIGHKAIFTVAPPKRGRYFFTIYVKDEKGSELLQSASAFQVTCREGREAIKSPYPKVSFFGPTQCMSGYGLLPQTHIDPLVSYNHDDINFQFAASRTVRLSYSLTFHCQRADAVDADLQRYAFLRHRDDTSMALQVRCPHIGKYVFSIYGAKSCNPEDPEGQYECLFRYLIDCKQSATNKSPLPRACHRWCHSQLLEPIHGDLEVGTRVMFRVRAPLVCDMALLMGDAWFHFRQHPDCIWEACIVTSYAPCSAKLYARLNRDTARFSPFLEFQIVGRE